VLSRRDLTGTILGGLGAVALAGCAASDDDAHTGQGVQELTGTSIRWADTINGTAGLKALNSSNCQAVIVEGYWAAGDGGGGVFVWVTGPAPTSSTPGFDGTIVAPTTQPATTGYWQRLHDGPISVRYFGARGDGATSDTAAINRALTLAQSTASAGRLGAEVYFPPGTYCADNLQITQHNVTLRGAGKSSILAKESTSNALITVGAVSNVTIRDLTIQMKSGVSPNFWGIYSAASTSFLTIDQVYMQGMGYGIGLEPALPSQVHNAVIRDCHLNVITNQGIALFNAIDTFISDSGVYMNGYSAGSVGLQMDSGCDGLYTSNLIVTQGETPIAIQSSNPGIAGNAPPRHGFFSRTAADGGSGGSPATIGAWVIKNGHRMHLEECWAATQQAAASGIVIQGDGSPLSPSTGIECVNCICIGNTANGIWIQGGTQIGIVGGACIGNHGAGIRANNASRIRIVGVRSAPDSDFPLQSFGIALGAGLSSVVVQGCDLVGNTSAAVSNLAVNWIGAGTNLGA